MVQDWFNVPLAIPDGLTKASIQDDVADVALPADDPLASRQSLTLDDLAGASWISPPEGAICREWLLLTMRRHDIEPVINHVANEYATQLALVAAGLGYGVLPRLGRADVPEGVALVAVEPSLTRHVYAIWRREAARRPAIQAVVTALRDAGPDGSGSRPGAD